MCISLKKQLWHRSRVCPWTQLLCMSLFFLFYFSTEQALVLSIASQACYKTSNACYETVSHRQGALCYSQRTAPRMVYNECGIARRTDVQTASVIIPFSFGFELYIPEMLKKSGRLTRTLHFFVFLSRRCFVPHVKTKEFTWVCSSTIVNEKKTHPEIAEICSGTAYTPTSLKPCLQTKTVKSTERRTGDNLVSDWSDYSRVPFATNGVRNCVAVQWVVNGSYRRVRTDRMW